MYIYIYIYIYTASGRKRVMNQVGWGGKGRPGESFPWLHVAIGVAKVNQRAATHETKQALKANCLLLLSLPTSANQRQTTTNPYAVPPDSPLSLCWLTVACFCGPFTGGVKDIRVADLTPSCGVLLRMVSTLLLLVTRASEPKVNKSNEQKRQRIDFFVYVRLLL
eukprot:gene6705-4802_t